MSNFTFTSPKGPKPIDLEKKISIKVIIAFIIGILIVITLFSSVTIVSEGFIGVKYRFNKIQNANLQAGLNLHIPFVEKIVQVDIREQVYQSETDAYTKDTQSVEDLHVKLNYFYDRAQLSEIIRNVGIDNVENKLVVPQVQSIVKNEIGQFRAEEFVQNRVIVQQNIEDRLRERLERNGIIVAAFAIENIKFEDGFEEAVRAKVVAEQDALKMQNKTKEKEEYAKQVVIEARANADSEKIRAEAEAYAIDLIQEKLKDSPQYIELEKINKWNGELPQAIGETINPFLVLGEDGTISVKNEE